MTISTSAASAWKRPRAVLTVYGLLGGICLVWAVLNVMAIDSDPNNRILFGLSFQRLVLVTLGLLTAAGLIGSGLKIWKDPLWTETCWGALASGPRSGTRVRWLSLLIFCLSWIYVFTPLDRFGDFQSYLDRLHPFLIWLLFFGGLTLLISLLGKYTITQQEVGNALRSRRQAIAVALLTILSGMAIIGLSSWLNLYRREDYTYGAGVPVLGLQVLLALGAALLLHYVGLTRTLGRIKRLDLWVCLILWGLTAFLWVREPVPPSYFNTGPYPPNHEYYPFSDAALYDLSSQYILIGQGLNSGAAFDRPLYLQFLFFLHLAAGQNYEHIVNIQSAILALFPVFLYLIGKELAGRPFGIGLGVLSTLRGLNTIAAASMIDLGSPKQLLTDFPMALGTAILVYLIVKWLRRPGENRLFVFWAGGVLALLSLIRTNAVLLIIPVAILLIVVHRRKLIMALAQPAVLLLMLLVTILPWGIPSKTLMWDVYILKFQDVIQQRYGGGSSLFASRNIAQLQMESLNPLEIGSAGEAPKLAALRSADRQLDIGFIPRHFFQNLLTSFLILPASPELHDLRSTVKEVFPFWRQAWDGSFGAGVAVFLAAQFVLFSFGVGMAWRRAGLAGLAPLAVFLVYQLTNALGRTSGGRFIVPVDWIVLLYYLLGLIEMFFLVFEMADRGASTPDNIQALPSDDFHWSRDLTSKAFGIFSVFIFIGLSPAITGGWFPVRYSDEQAQEVMAQLNQTGSLGSIGATLEILEQFIGQPSAVIIHGRALYPRYYPAGAGELDNGFPFLTLPYPRLAFIVIGPRGSDNVIFPLERAPSLPNASDVLILGCHIADSNPNSNVVNALAVFVLQENGPATVYARQPAAPLQCPAAAIVCNEAKECRSGP